jgi:hypothetical protein
VGESERGRFFVHYHANQVSAVQIDSLLEPEVIFTDNFLVVKPGNPYAREVRVEIYDLSGKRIHNSHFVGIGEGYQIPVDWHASGILLIKILEDSNYYYKKIWSR